MSDKPRFEKLYAGADGPGRVFPSPGAGSILAGLLTGLAARFALAVQFWTWARANAAPVTDVFDWRSWATPSAGLEIAAGVWTMGRFPADQAAFIILTAAMLTALSLMAGFLTRLTGLLVVAGAVWHSLYILPQAWPTTIAFAALGLYLVLRGAGAASLDWALARLSRFN